MKIGIIGLGHMGEAIAYRVMQAGHQVVGFDTNKNTCERLQKEGVTIVDGVKNIAQESVDAIWLMVPQGKLVDDILKGLEPYVSAGAIIIDGGNSKFTDSIRRAKQLAQKNSMFLDCGTSGGLHGKKNGFCLMIGGDITAYKKIIPLCAAIAAPDGYAHVGPSGAGHYVKMVHNGIEYGLLQAYAEGFQVLKEGSFKREKLDLAQIAALWGHGSIIRSWIVELVRDIMVNDQEFVDISGEVESTGMGEWTVDEAHEYKVPVPVIETSLHVRKISQETGGNYGTKIVALLRNAFGGHRIKKLKKKEE